MTDYSKNAPNLSAYSFPHLDDTSFPMLENVDVYDYQNNFDYSRWTDNTKIYLCNVLWNNDYSNVVKFKDDDERDAYFDSLNGYTVELQSAFNISPNGVVKVPIPYQVATRYNYMYVDLPIMTSEDEPINYENPRRTQRYYYFINGIAQNAPSSTTLVVAPDNWTTYINNVDIPYMMLERGHAPMASIDVDTYLSNPMQNNRYLLAPDFDFANGDDMVKDATFVPINNGEKYVLFASTMSSQQIMNQVYPPTLSNVNTPATFADAPMRNGYQYIVNDYDWGIGDYDYNGMYTQTTSFQSANDVIPNNMTMIAVQSVNANSLFSYMSEHIPFFYKTIKACFMVDDTMFTKGQQFQFCNTICYLVNPAADSVLQTITFAKSDFNYDNKYAGIAKLYTSPYARIEVTDNNGTTKAFKIENTSDLQIHQATSIAFPYISLQAYISGINGSGYSTYSWRKLSNTTATKIMFDDDFGDYLWDWEIPTYALYVRGYDDYKASNYPSQFVNRYNAIADYHKSVGMDNTQYENAKDSADTTQTMTNNSANTENANAVNSANTIYTNNVASADTAHSNAYASANTAQTNVYNVANNNIANTAVDTARNSDVTSEEISLKVEVGSANSTKVLADNQNANYVTAVTTDIENQQTITTSVASGISSVTSGVAGAASHAGVGNFAGAVGSVIEAAGNCLNTGLTAAVTTTSNSAIAATTISANNTNANNTNTTNFNNTANTNVTNRSITNINNTAATTITANTAATMKKNADNTNATEKANADRTQATSNANSARTQSTSIANADRTKDNTIGNAALNRNTSVANSGYTRGTAVDNAKITLEQKRISNQQQYYTSRLSAPVQYGSNSGDPTLDAFERRGLQVKIRTQSDGNIAQAGDLMLRYGYALNQVWNVSDSGLMLMKHFTYWKASDLWINEGEGVNQDAQSDIQRAFESGVTVWNDPNMIGKVSIYDNWN